MGLKKNTRNIIYYLFVVLLLSFACTKEQLITTNKTPIVNNLKTIGGSKNDIARSIVATSDGGYIIAGSSQSNDGDIIKANQDYDYLVLKFDSNNQLEWQKTYGGTKDDRCEKIIQTLDGSYVLVGYNKSNDGNATSNNGFQDVWILKIDNFGNLLWEKSFGFAGADQGYSVLQTSDGGYFISGILDVSASEGLGNKKVEQNKHAGGDYWALKLDALGELQWRNYFGGTNTDTCYDAVETNDGYILVGSSDSTDVDIKNNKGGYDYWVVKINKTGQFLWEKNFGGNEIETTYTIKITNDDNFILAGESRSSDQDITTQNGGADVWILKIDTNGNKLWEKSYGGTSFDAARDITSTNDGGFIIAGSSRSSDIDVTENKGQNDALVLKIRANGNLEWQKTIGGNEIDFAYSLAQLKNGNIVAVGDTNSLDGDIIENKGFTDILIININEE